MQRFRHETHPVYRLLFVVIVGCCGQQKKGRGLRPQSISRLIKPFQEILFVPSKARIQLLQNLCRIRPLCSLWGKCIEKSCSPFHKAGN